MRRAFTLIELLVVIAIIAILAAILFPVFAQAKLAAKKTKALSQMKQLGTAVYMYASDVDDFFVPASNRSAVGQDPTIWPPLVEPYAKNREIFVAPESEGTFAESWNGRADGSFSRRNQSIGYSDATGVDPTSTAIAGNAAPGTEGFTSGVSFSIAEEAARTGLFATTPNSRTGKERGYVFNPYNGPNSPDGDYFKGLPLIADVNLCTTVAPDGNNYSTRAAGLLKPIFARYGASGRNEGQTPVIFADSHAKSYSARQLNAFGTVIWRFR